MRCDVNYNVCNLSEYTNAKNEYIDDNNNNNRLGKKQKISRHDEKVPTESSFKRLDILKLRFARQRRI